MNRGHYSERNAIGAHASRGKGLRGGSDLRDDRAGFDERRDPAGSGQVIAQRYVVLAHIADTRRSRIYEAVDQNVANGRPPRARRVAIHYLRERLVDARLFEALAQLRAQPDRWRHPNVLEVLGFGRQGNHRFIVTEPLEGLTLRAILDDAAPERLEPEEALAILGRVGAALSYAHASGAAHAELGPETVFITTQHVVKVLDLWPSLADAPFAAAMAVDEADVDPRDDVHALGSLAAELLASSPESAATMRERAQSSPTVGSFLAELGVTGRERLAGSAAANADAAPPPHRPTPAAEPVTPRPRAPRAAPAARLAPPVRRIATPARRRPVHLRSGERSLLFTVAATLLVFGALLFVTLRPYVAPRAGAELVAAPADRELAVDAARGLPAVTALDASELDAAAPDDGAVATVAVDAAVDTAVDAAVEPEVATVEPAAAAADLASAPTARAGGTGFAFASAVTRVSEGATMARVAIHRADAVDSAERVYWWTGGHTAKPDDDYVDLGDIETFAAAEASREVFVPLINDGIGEGTESFFVYLGTEPRSARLQQPVAQIEIVIADDD